MPDLKMRLSDQAEYLIAIPAMVAGDHARARSNLATLLVRAEADGDLCAVGYLLQTLGNIEAKDGNLAAGHALHQRAINLDPKSPLPLLEYAKGLFRVFECSSLAEEQLARAEALLSSTSWIPEEDEPSREWYQKELDELRDKMSGHKL